jgi:anti-sigma regulatory factor (Ser/Thr protein kinase)
VTPAARTHLDAVPASAGAARHFVRDLLVAWDCDDPDEIAVLLTSEIVSNAVRHAADELGINVLVGLTDDVLRIEVHDGGPGEPRMQRPPDGAVSGRGLLLVDALARRWGADRNVTGKVVWFELPARRRQST